MLFFAHAFLGALIGLGFGHMTHDRRAVPLCITSAVLSDLLDKPLALLFPGILGAGRTLGHSLLFFFTVASLGCIFWRYRHTLLGIACACAVFSHQILDEMWNVPQTWFYPLLGPFPVYLSQDYLVVSFWREVSSGSEWIFAYASIVIIAAWYPTLPEDHPVFPAGKTITTARFVAVLLLGVMGIVLLMSGTGFISGTCLAPVYTPVTGMMAGLVALGGAMFLQCRPLSAPSPAE